MNLSRIKTKDHNVIIPNKNKDITIKYFSDIHISNSFNIKLLDKILNELNRTKIDYVTIGGDIIDSTNLICNNNYRKIIIEWLKELSNTYKTLISLGNHDFMKKINSKQGYSYEYLSDFWQEVNNIDNLYLSHFNKVYEDENIFVYMPELDFSYYINEKKEEDINLLINRLKEDNTIYSNKTDKIKIMMIHSPYLLSDPRVKDYIKEFDIILSGHMHNGLVMPIINELIKNNIGIITPSSKLFKDNCRGDKTIKNGDSITNLIISGGITKLAYNSGFLRNFNFIYPSNIENIKILSKK